VVTNILTEKLPTIQIHQICFAGSFLIAILKSVLDEIHDALLGNLPSIADFESFDSVCMQEVEHGIFSDLQNIAAFL
jgi:hypothetical protein